MIVDIGDTCTHCGVETLTNKRIASSVDAEISVVFNERERIFPARINGYMCVGCQDEDGRLIDEIEAIESEMK